MKKLLKIPCNKIALIFSFLFIMTFNLGNLQTVNAETGGNIADISEQVNLKWIVTGSGDQKDISLVEEEINEYLEDKINATVDITTYLWGDDFNNRITIMAAAGEPYDINFTSNWTAYYSNLASAGAFKDITDMLDTYAPKTKAFLGKNILKGAEVNGRVYAIPVYNSSIVDSCGIVVNNELVKKYNIDISKIKKIQDLEPILKTVKSKDKKLIAFCPFDKYGNQSDIVNLLNYDVFTSDCPGAVLRDGKSTKVINEFETNDAKNLFSLMNKWYKAGYIPKSAPSGSQFFDSNKNNIFAMYSNITASTRDEMINYDMIDMVPVQLGNSALTTNGIRGAMQAISSTSKNPERALMFLELVNTDNTLSDMINYGIEGLHYERTGNNTITQLLQDEYSYNPGTAWIFGNESIASSLPGYSPERWNAQDKRLKTAVLSPLLGFEFDPSPVKDQVSKIYNIKNKYLSDLSLGKVNPTTTLSKMNSEMKKAGLQKILTEMQKQVDKFKSRK